jgi:hypothetical protein
LYLSGVKRALVIVVLAAALLPSAASSAGSPDLHPTLRGTCTVANRVDHNDVLLSSTVTCTTKANCTCSGAKTQLAYNSHWFSPGSGGKGPERGVLVATDKNATVTLKLTGTRDGSGQSVGKWVLSTVSGAPKSGFRSAGTYTAHTTWPVSELGPTLDVQITTTISCWSC